ncbi:putative phospholipase [Monocercomonoides exilis]|uniref:putative phospholipase n=1 Tax=Monocercomonoides exilis TaxID=2049356 RepID=UPI00355A102D|nr:putative phospholipase [Monocercomonoides exilis]|eukprot:MONOS_5056.1-p1 / transcript=MONOS_5056.1 / gene=MONOS_5056 / organism=Monocercomonoides_exilis_PA203 / gene_product=phospholipase / transcript_product=phospholipase / location=Mono_scaffold00143:32506-33595(-) / protein_length=265 / sequence_SO=supercontig / SO=protein_coding / is_pseudo=false
MQISVAHFVDVRLQTPDSLELHGWFLPYSNDSPVLVYCHGNAGNIEYRAYKSAILRRGLKCNVFCFDYRGFGHSSPEVNPTHSGLIVDLEVVMNYLQKLVVDGKASKIWMLGHSIGGAVCCDFVAKHSEAVDLLILENTIYSLQSTALQIVPRYLKLFVPLCVPPVWRNNLRMKDITTDTIFISGQSDTLVSPEDSKKLYELCAARHKLFISLKDGEHNTDWAKYGFEIFEAITKFIADRDKIELNREMNKEIKKSSSSNSPALS